MVSVLMSGDVWDRKTQAEKKKFFSMLMLLLFGSSLLLAILVWVRINAEVQPPFIFVAILIACIGFGIGGPYYIPTSIFTLRNTVSSAGTLSGIIDGASYAGAMVFDYLFGFLAQQGYWALVPFLVATLTALSAPSLFKFIDHEKDEVPIVR
jgi:MFS family permease